MFTQRWEKNGPPTVCTAPTTTHERLPICSLLLPQWILYIPSISEMTVLITGANGRTSRQVIRTLLFTPNCPPLRLLVNSQASLIKLGSTFPQLYRSPHKIFIGDYLDPDTLPPAFDGVSVVFHNGPAFHRLEASMGIAVIDAAMQSGANPHIIFCSILHPMRSKIIDNKAKLT